MKFLIEFTYFQYLIFGMKAGNIDNFYNDDILIVICLTIMTLIVLKIKLFLIKQYIICITFICVIFDFIY